MYTLVSIVVGVISGIITSVILFFVAQIVRKIIIPWYAEFIYKGVNIGGTWRGVIDNQTSKFSLVVNLKQNAFQVSGVFYAETITQNPEKNYSNQYKLSGVVKNHMMTLNYEALSKERTGVGTMLLRSYKGGTSLSGYLIHSEDADKSWIKELKLKRD
jgi:hypothetical protein